MRPFARLISAFQRLLALDADQNFTPGRAVIFLTYFRLMICLLWFRATGRPMTTFSIFGVRWNFASAETFIYVFEEIFIDQVYRFYPESDSPTIIDAGANSGLAALYFKLRWPKSRVECYEPNPESFTIMSKNLTGARFSGVVLHQIALAEFTGAVTFFTDVSNPTSLGAGSKAGGNLSEITVAGLSLRNVLSQPVDFLKLDVEGAELAIIRGAASSLSNVKRLVIECHHRPDIHDNLAELLTLLSREKFHYRLSSQPARSAFNTPMGQDILIYAWSVRP